jgi:multiple sugar transport system substrate-binding protein
MAQAGHPAQARLQGKLQVVQVLDFHPDHNAFLKKTITDYAAAQRWDLDLSDLAGFLAGADIYQKLNAQKQAGQPVDMIFHGLSARILNLFQLTRDATALVNRAVQRYGRPYSSARATHVIDNKWIGLPFYDRVGGYWLRADKFAEMGYSVEAGHFETWEGVLEACKAVSRPDQNFYGWGMTVNRSGDGESLVWNIIWQWGGALADPTGQIVTLYSPETIDAMTWLSNIYLNPDLAYILPPGVNSWTDPSNNEAYLAGTIGFTSNAGTVYAKAVFDGNPVADVTDLIQVPLGPYGVRLQGSGGHYFYFMEGSRNFDAAAQLAEYLLSDEVQTVLWRTSPGYVVPAYEDRWNNPIIAENRISQRFKPVSFTEPPFQGVAYRGPLSEAADAVSAENVATDMMGEILAGKPVEAAVRDAHFRCVAIYQSFGYKGR